VESAQQMLDAVLERFDQSDIVVKSAAVADYRPVTTHGQKIKKSGETLTLELEKTTDILQTLGGRKKHQFLIGFAAETEQLEKYAMDKLTRKNCDLIVGNDVSLDGAGFNGDTNIVQLFGPSGLIEAMPMLSKRETAQRILAIAAQRIAEGTANNGGRGE
jgi:phosphopantothenoylcysteine decarboxylase/phosphopantothenate--cysteine ligase